MKESLSEGGVSFGELLAWLLATVALGFASWTKSDVFSRFSQLFSLNLSAQVLISGLHAHVQAARPSLHDFTSSRLKPFLLQPVRRYLKKEMRSTLREEAEPFCNNFYPLCSGALNQVMLEVQAQMGEYAQLRGA